MTSEPWGWRKVERPGVTSYYALGTRDRVFLRAAQGGPLEITEEAAAMIEAVPDLITALKAMQCALLGWADNGLQLAHATRLADEALRKAEPHRETFFQ